MTFKFECVSCGYVSSRDAPELHDNLCPKPVWTLIDYDPVNHPTHYNSSGAHCKCGREIECIDITRNLGFNLGNALKYIWRSEHKNGAEDIKKAIWYLQDYLKNLSPESVDNSVCK